MPSPAPLLPLTVSVIHMRREAKGIIASGHFRMRKIFKLTLLAAALGLVGCGSHTPKPAELSTVPAQSQFDDRIQDALGTQKYTEAQMLYQRRFNDYQNQIDDLEKKRADLDARLNARAYESGLSDAPASTSEAGRIQEYQAASKASQARVAEASSKMAIQQSLIENRRDKELLQADNRAAQQIADIEISSAKELSTVEDRINQDIEGRRSIDSAARLAESKRFDEQRFSLALANADAERQAKEKLGLEAASLDRIRGEASAREGVQTAKISELKRQIAEIESQIIKTRGDDELAIRAQQSKVSFAQGEVDRLAKISQDLKSSTSSAQIGLTPSGSDYVQAKNTELSRARADGDSRKAQRISDVNARAAIEKNEIISRARTELAALSASTEMAKADVVSPVVTGRAVYSGADSVQKALPSKGAASTPPTKLSAPAKPVPVLTINRFEPKVSSAPSAIPNEQLGSAVLAGSTRLLNASPTVAPLVVAPKTRSVYDVFYVYRDEGSWVKFQEYLKAYGITDFQPTRNNKAGEFFIYCGRYYDKDEAAARVSYLNKTTSTSNVKVRETLVPF